ncbi:MAG TPA: TonB-dependent receptor [Bacteroidales bacterium]|nr:TonB-dependent receptor [Bacteroidales bacterium]
MLTKCFAAILWVALPFLALGQHQISGRVFDAADHSPLPGTNIVVKGTFKGAFTGSDGHFSLSGLVAGDHTLHISFLGYESREVIVQVPMTDVVIVGLERSATLASEVVVVGLRADSRTPATFTNVTAEQLAAKNLGQDLPYLLNLTPSLVVTSDAGAGVGYTWMNIRGSDNTRVNITLNSIPLNDAESHGVWWVNKPDLASSLENVQVQRGVGLSTHGAGAFGATISMTTLGLRESAHAELENSFGSFNTLKNTAQFGTGLVNERWSFEGRLSRIVSDGFIDRATSDLRSFYLSGGFFGRNTIIQGVALSGAETTYQAWNGVPGNLLQTNRTYNPSGRFTDNQGVVRYYENETDNYQQDHYQLHLSHAFTTKTTGNVSLFYTRGRGYFEQFRDNERFSRYNLPNLIIGAETITRTDLIRRRWLDNHYAGLVYSFKHNPAQNLSLTLGGGYKTYWGRHFGEIIWAEHALNIPKGWHYYDNDAVKQDFNTFLKVNYELISGLNLFADMQYRYINYTFEGPAWVLGEVSRIDQEAVFHFVNPKIGLNWVISPQSSMYAFGGIGNREPVRRDFTESSPESRPRHETLRNIELGYRFQGRNTMFAANLYLMDYKNQLVLTGEINDVGGFTRMNIEDSYRLGIELQGGLIISERWRWEGNASFSRNKIPLFVEFSDVFDNNWEWTGTESRVYENTDIAFSPSVVAASMLSYEPLNDLVVTLNTKYVGRQFIDNTQNENRMLDAFFVNDLRINYVVRPGFFREVELVFQVNNILNHNYETNAWIYKGVVGEQGLITIEDGYFPQAGRHFMAGLNLRF